MDPAQGIEIRVSRFPYRLVAVIAPAVAITGSVLTSYGNAGPAAALFLSAAILFPFTMIASSVAFSPHRYRITPEHIEISRRNGTCIIPYISIRRMKRGRGHRRFSIRIESDKRAITIGRWTRPDSNEILHHLTEGVTAHLGSRRLTGEGIPDHLGGKMEARRIFRTMIQESIAQKEDAYLFGNLPGRTARRMFIVSLLLVALVLLLPGGLLLLSPDGRLGGVLLLILGGMGMILVLARAVDARRRQWILFHRNGIAMYGHHLTGELEWDDIMTAQTRPPASISFALTSEQGSATRWRLEIETVDGSRIQIPDIFDVPLGILERLVRNRGGEERPIPPTPSPG